MSFIEKNKISKVAENILKKRYFQKEEKTWEDVVNRVIDFIFDEKIKDESGKKDWDLANQIELTRELLLFRYFIPNSPCLVNAGKQNGGLAACFVVDFPDTIEGIYKTKLDFALIAKKGGGCGTTLSKLRPEGEIVSGSAHGYAGGPVKFFNTICHDMEVMTQAGFREMAMLGSMSVYHPDILKFVDSKENEGVMRTANISVLVDDDFMDKVIKDESYYTFFGDKKYDKYHANDIFNLIVEGAWRNGEPGILFYNQMNNSPYSVTGQEILTTNPCGEQGLPSNGVCNLGSLDVSKFLSKDNFIDLGQLEIATRLAIRFLDRVIEKSSYPTEDIKEWAFKNRPVGLGIMGFADYCLKRELAYGSQDSANELGFILKFIRDIAEDESIQIGEELGIPEECKKLPIPRRNITLLSIAPTGTISLLAGCNSGIEPVFSELTIRNDKTGSYSFENELYSKPYFRCAVSANGGQEVSWEEHILIQATAQSFVDAGVSKTINFPTNTKKSTIRDAFIYAWKSGCKGLTV
jgi:ribonucleoside-diphosphate reductase alpha chain